MRLFSIVREFVCENFTFNRRLRYPLSHDLFYLTGEPQIIDPELGKVSQIFGSQNRN